MIEVVSEFNVRKNEWIIRILTQETSLVFLLTSRNLMQKLKQRADKFSAIVLSL